MTQAKPANRARHYTVLMLLWMSAASAPLPANALDLPRNDLAEAIQALIDAHQGKVAVSMKHLTTGETFQFRSDEPMPTASLIKLAVMIEVYEQAREGKVRLEDSVTLAEADKVPGSGILTAHFSAGTTMSLRDAVRLMMVFSDNTATNLVLDKIGIGSTAARMESWGFANTKIHSKVFRRETSIAPERSQQFGLGSTTAAEMIALLEQIHGGRRIAESDRVAMLDHLKHCDDKDKFPRRLPAGTVVAHKTGSVERSRTDAGIIYSPSGPIALCVLTSDNEDRSWRPDNAGNALCAAIARCVYDHFNSKGK